MLKALATCGEGTPETTGVFHDLRELQVAAARLTMFKAVAGLNAEEGAEIEVLQMRQCARCALIFTEFVGPAGRMLLHMHLPPEGLMI